MGQPADPSPCGGAAGARGNPGGAWGRATGVGRIRRGTDGRAGGDPGRGALGAGARRTAGRAAGGRHGRRHAGAARSRPLPDQRLVGEDGRGAGGGGARPGRQRDADPRAVGRAALPSGVECVPVRTAVEMCDAVLARQPQTDVLIGAAAVADFRPADPAAQKIKKTPGQEDLTVRLVRNPDILAEVAARRAETGWPRRHHRLRGRDARSAGERGGQAGRQETRHNRCKRCHRGRKWVRIGRQPGHPALRRRPAGAAADHGERRGGPPGMRSRSRSVGRPVSHSFGAHGGDDDSAGKRQNHVSRPGIQPGGLGGRRSVRPCAARTEAVPGFNRQLGGLHLHLCGGRQRASPRTS